jgi:hypothetical protein
MPFQRPQAIRAFSKEERTTLLQSYVNGNYYLGLKVAY